MIDLILLREKPDYVAAMIARKDPSYDVERLIDLDRRLRQLRTEVEQIRQQRNEAARGVRPGSIAQEDRLHARGLVQRLKEREEELNDLESQFTAHYLRCPNLPLQEIPVGGKEANEVVRVWGEKPQFSFVPQHHVALNDRARWFDFGAGARMAASQFAFYESEGAHLIYTLALMMMQHNKRNGYRLVLPPYVVNEQTLEGASNFPKFRDAVYAIPEDNLFLTPTAEVNLTALYRDRLFMAEELPVRMTAWTSCFRREAGTYGATERGLIRVHQFEKVELYTIATPEQAAAEHMRMIGCAEELLQQLGLHYRISLLAGQDASFAAAKTYDLEVWMPGQGEYKEVSSASNCSDFQARRCGIRYRSPGGGKPSLVYTLNTSSLALPRIIVALMETYQQADGTIALPPILDTVVWSRS